MQKIIVDMTPGHRMPTIYFSQGDVGTQFAIDLRSRFGNTLPASPTVTIQATKPSGFGFSVSATSLTNGVAIFTTTAEMTDEAGYFPAELKVVKDSVTLFTANFNMAGKATTHPEGTIDGSAEEVIPELTQLVERVEDAASSVLDMTVEAETLAAGSQATYSYDEETNTATFGIPQGEAGAGAAGVTANAYSSSATYAVGDYVIHNSNLYRCTTAITTAEAFTAAHWTQVVLADDVTDLKSDLFVEYSAASVWEQGAISSSNGTNSDSTTRIRTADYISKTIDTISPSTGYKVMVFAYDNSGEYKGVWNGSALANSGTWLETDVEIKLLPDYNYKLVFADTSNNTILPASGTNCRFTKHTDGTLSMWRMSADAGAVGEALNGTNETVNDLKTIEGEYQSQSIIVVEDKYIFQGGTSQYNGTVQNDTGSGYVKVLVKEGERYKISGASNKYHPLVVMFNTTIIGNSGYVGVDGESATPVAYNDRDFVVPSGIKMICVNTISNSSYPISVKKFTATKRIKYLAELDINSFANNPLEYIGNEISTFNKILCIGDSLTVGGKNTPPITPDDSHATREVTNEMYSYPRNLKKNYGCEYTVKAIGGITSGEWITTYGNDDLTGHDCAIIFLGSNDHMEMSRGMTAQEAIEAHHANILSIINLVRSQNYGMPIFLCTAFPGWNDAYNVAVGCNANMRDICETTSGVYLIDFQKYSLLRDNSPYRYTHPTALGYMQMAKEIAGAVCYYMKNDAADFKWIQYVGTRWAVEIN